MLSLKGLDVPIGPVAILPGVNLGARAGEFAGLVGRGGPGKAAPVVHRHAAAARDFGPAGARGEAAGLLAAHRRASFGTGHMPDDRRLLPGPSAEENMPAPAACSTGSSPATGER